MIFRTYEPYYNNEENKYNETSSYYLNDDNKDCFICFEIHDASMQKPIDLHNQCDYISICSCNGCVHKNCLALWIKNSNKCPICRENITIIGNSKFVEILSKVNPRLLKFIILNKHLLLKMCRFFFTLLFFYCIGDLYLEVFRMFLDRTTLFDNFDNLENIEAYLMNDYYENKFIIKKDFTIILYENFKKNITHHNHSLLK